MYNIYIIGTSSSLCEQNFQIIIIVIKPKLEKIMNGLRKLSLMAAMLVCTTLAAVAQKPNIHILATGGTIAGTGASATKTH